MFQATENLYNNEVRASPLIGLTLLDATGQEVQVSQGSVLIRIPVTASEEIVPTCEFWNESTQVWSEEGCELVPGSYWFDPANASAGASVLCNCTHLTTFSCPLVYPNHDNNKN